MKGPKENERIPAQSDGFVMKGSPTLNDAFGSFCAKKASVLTANRTFPNCTRRPIDSHLLVHEDDHIGTRIAAVTVLVLSWRDKNRSFATITKHGSIIAISAATKTSRLAYKQTHADSPS